MLIPFNKPFMTGNELSNIADAHVRRCLSGDGYYTKKCHEWIENIIGAHRAFLTHSCTAALEMASILLEIKPGDEVIMPSYTFVSTANAFVLRGAVPVFVDIRLDTLNIDETLINSAMSNKTKAIVPVHYAGVACEMDAIEGLAKEFNIKVVEDAAQALGATYKGRLLGTIGDLAAYSFHETKNVISGEGGALLVNNSEYEKRSEIIREKGTNRTSFMKGDVDKYSWVDIGSSYLPGELTAAFLFSQLEGSNNITRERLRAWNFYHESLKELEISGILRRPIVPDECMHNGHMYYILLNNNSDRDSLMLYLKRNDIHAVSHYVPLHDSPAGKIYSKTIGDMNNTKKISESILRLPMYTELSDNDIGIVAETISKWAKTEK